MRFSPSAEKPVSASVPTGISSELGLLTNSLAKPDKQNVEIKPAVNALSFIFAAKIVKDENHLDAKRIGKTGGFSLCNVIRIWVG